jgi:hypothetical protein
MLSVSERIDQLRHAEATSPLEKELPKPREDFAIAP